jgi:general L-amino acid transport system permease protein
LVNVVIGLFKDTALVSVVGLSDLMLSARGALGEPQWQAFALEDYLFVGAVYFAICLALSRYSRWLEGRLRP